MGPYLYSGAPPDFIEKLSTLEKQSDRCHERLSLFSYPWNVGAWGVLTGYIVGIEDTLNARGPTSPAFHAQMINIGRDASLLLEWVRAKAGHRPAPRSRFRWTPPLRRAAAEGAHVAHQYMTFKSHFPMWYKGHGFAEIIDDSTIRFSPPTGGNQRRVAAFQKGLHAGATRPGMPSLAPPKPGPALLELLGRCKRGGTRRFSYPEPRQALREILPTYAQRLTVLSRREESLDLGRYTLANFKQFFSALLTISSVHEYLCFAWGTRHNYPADSAVLVNRPQRWIELIADLCPMSSTTAESILNSLILPDKTRDVFLHPFIPLDSESRVLGIAPHVVLRSNYEENVLRICSHQSPAAYDEISRLKEAEMFKDLTNSIPPRYSPRGSVKLPPPWPDLDLVLEDKATSTIILAELKWLRKPIGLERLDRDKDFVKGVAQLKRIGSFLSGCPTYLSDRKVLSAPLPAYRRVQYLLVARDHFNWIDPDHDCPMAEYETFKHAVRDATDLQAALETLLSYEWLPQEGRDFVVRYERFCVEGVCIEAEVYYGLHEVN